MDHLSRPLVTAHIEDLHREAARMHTIRLARRVKHTPHAPAASRVTQALRQPLIRHCWALLGPMRGRSRP
jgi:hypothetical protein